MSCAYTRRLPSLEIATSVVSSSAQAKRTGLLPRFAAIFHNWVDPLRGDEKIRYLLSLVHAKPAMALRSKVILSGFAVNEKLAETRTR
jgi:hypothetical protein